MPGDYNPRTSPEARLDSDLAESVSALKDSFERRRLPAAFGAAPPERLDQLRAQLRVPRRYRDFLKKCDPLQCETSTPSERVQLIASAQLLQEQEGFALSGGQLISAPRDNGWRPSWIVIAHSTLLGDPYFLDVSEPDAEGDCPVYTAMSGTDRWEPRLCASSFAMFLRVLAVTMEVARGFHASKLDYEDEFVFREALGPKIREYDPAALKAGHWT
ncbi:MAG TPA: SMI1/KNR4 family protein [Polyangiaceae bacterium]|nr:SMI1/KNR4 family protein [Polyangiaceae bacterium]